MLDTLLCDLEYRPEDDSWDMDGRRTYSHEMNITQAKLTRLGNALKSLGWLPVKSALRTFRNVNDGEVIELEPCGEDCRGHYLHLMKPEAANVH